MVGDMAQSVSDGDVRQRPDVPAILQPSRGTASKVPLMAPPGPRAPLPFTSRPCFSGHPFPAPMRPLFRLLVTLVAVATALPAQAPQRAVLVTGASSGIGRKITERLARG